LGAKNCPDFGLQVVRVARDVNWAAVARGTGFVASIALRVEARSTATPARLVCGRDLL
jgi:hypothetical protein